MSQSIRLSLYRHRVECVVFVEWKPYSACVGKRDDTVVLTLNQSALQYEAVLRHMCHVMLMLVAGVKQSSVAVQPRVVLSAGQIS
jgi:hypothetical protein